MASGDPPITGNPADKTSGTISIEAIRSDNPDNVLKVKLKKNRRLQIVINTGVGSDPVTLVADAADWSLKITEID